MLTERHLWEYWDQWCSKHTQACQDVFIVQKISQVSLKLQF